jgi:hypothetical protein
MGRIKDRQVGHQAALCDHVSGLLSALADNFIHFFSIIIWQVIIIISSSPSQRDLGASAFFSLRLILWTFERLAGSFC